MKKTGFISLLLLFVWYSSNAQNKTTTIDIDATRNDKLTISQIAESVIPIPLDINDINEPVVSKVIITPDYLYVRISDKGNPYARKRNCQLGRDGTINGEVGMKDTETDDFINSAGLFYSENTNELVIVYKDYLAIFDVNGKFKRRIDNIKAKGLYYVYDNRFFFYENSI